MPDTFADIDAGSRRAVNWRPATPVAEGVRRFVDWFRTWERTRARLIARAVAIPLSAPPE